MRLLRVSIQLREVTVQTSTYCDGRFGAGSNSCRAGICPGKSGQCKSNNRYRERALDTSRSGRSRDRLSGRRLRAGRSGERKQDLSGCLCCWREIANHLRHRSRQRGISRRGYRRNCARARLRFNRDGISWPSRSDAPRAGQSGPSRRNAEHDVGFDLPMKARIRLSAQPYRAWLARA